MSATIKHKKQSTVADGADTTKVRPQSDWNDNHKIEGGSHGNLLQRDTGEPDGFSFTDTPVVQAVRFLLTAPASPQNGDAWIVFSGTSPTRDMILRVQDGASLRSVVLATF